MENTTIAISREIKEKISEFGNKGETFSDILGRLLKSAEQRQLHDLLFNEEGCVTIEQAIKDAKEKKWLKL
ncbi:MAG: antitoxin VapB family protein [Nanoarchaeota archaeon]